MPTLSAIVGTVVDGSGVTLMARVLGQNGITINRAALTSISYAVSDLTLGTSLGTGTLTISSVVFDSLQQTDPRWSRDSETEPGPDGLWGYSFLATLPASLFPVTALVAGQAIGDPNLRQCDVIFTPVSGEVFRIPFRWKATRVMG